MNQLDPRQQLGLAEQLFATLQVGGQFGPWETVITRDDARAYAASIDDEDAPYLREPVSGRTICHPAMTCPFGIWLFQEERHRMLGEPAQPLVGVHAATSHEYSNPVPIGKRLIVRGTVTDKYIRRQRYYVVIRFSTVDEDGNDIVRSRDTYLLTPVRIPDDAHRPQEAASVGELPRRPEGCEELRPLTKVARNTARGKGIHDDNAAAALGFRQGPVPGVTTLAYVMDMLLAYFGGNWTSGGSIDLAFTKPVFEGERVTARGVVRDRQRHDENLRVLLDVWVENEADQRAAEGSASGILPPAGAP